MSTKLIILLLRSNFAIKTRISVSVFFPCNIYPCFALCLCLTIELLLTNPKMYFSICLAIISRWFACHATDQKKTKGRRLIKRLKATRRYWWKQKHRGAGCQAQWCWLISQALQPTLISKQDANYALLMNSLAERSWAGASQQNVQEVDYI